PHPASRPEGTSTAPPPASRLRREIGTRIHPPPRRGPGPSSGCGQSPDFSEAAGLFAAVFLAADFFAAVFLAAAFWAGAFLAAFFLAGFSAGALSRRSASSSDARSTVIDAISSPLRKLSLTSPSV